ncbi:hypothetical protein FRC05_001368 [Tulasnella sp. 425]|nr:hypothetical protein FRC05_001368 [Tulasnella sp. 425]
MPEDHGSEERCSTSSCRKGRPTMGEIAAVWPGPTTGPPAAKRWEDLVLHPLEKLELGCSMSYKHLCQGCADDAKARSRVFRDELVGQLIKVFQLEAEVGPDDDGNSYGGSDDYGPEDPEY